jgi:signal recognition particle subunit SRP72
MSSLNELFKQLEVDSANEQHEEVYETAYEILKTSPHDSRALRLVVVSLINLDRYLEALKVFRTYSQASQDGLKLEKLYVYYKLNLDSELADEFSHLSTEEVHKNKGLAHLKAQFLYRSGHYAEALDIYEVLAQETQQDDPELLDLSVNERAVLADGYQYGAFDEFASRTEVTPTFEDSYDLIFNESVIQVGLGNYSKSLELLDIAEEKCKEANTDIEDQFEETLPILLQRAYIMDVVGSHDQAEAILSQFQQSQIGDELNKLIFVNNSIARKSDSSANIHLVLKELHYPNLLNKLTGRLSIVQKSQIWKNYWKLSIKIGEPVTRKPFIKETDYTASALQSIAKAGINADEDNESTQAKKLSKYALSSKNLGAALLAAQLCIKVQRFEAALNVLDNLELESKVAPGVAHFIFQLCDKTRSEKKKLALFDQIVEFYNDETRFKQVKIYEFLKIVGLQFIAAEPEKSRQLLSRLNSYRQDDIISIALGQSSIKGLQTIDSLTDGLDLNELIQGASLELAKLQKSNPASFKVTKPRKRLMRKAPKEYDPLKKPDPERWLKLSDRSGFKEKKKGKKNATQGGVADNTTEEFIVKTKSTPIPKKNKKKGRK